MGHLKVKIGGEVIKISSKNSFFKFRLKKRYLAFQTRNSPDIKLEVLFCDLSNFKLKHPLFDTKGAWALYKVDGQYIFKLPSDSSPERIAILDEDFKTGKIYIEPKGLSLECLAYPLWYPLDELLIINTLSKKKIGLLVHSCGIMFRKKGILFMGNSGAGKSTIANLWKGKKDAAVLSDDRIIIRKEKSQFRIFGTPWHGDSEEYLQDSVVLEKVFFLKHAKKNSIKKIELFNAITRLFICSFPTFWDNKGMDFALNFCSELAQKISLYELGFIPDKSILDFINSV